MKTSTKVLICVYELCLIFLLTLLFLYAIGHHLHECKIGINGAVRNMTLLFEYTPLSLLLLSLSSPLAWWIFHRFSLHLQRRLLFSFLSKAVLLAILYLWSTTQAYAGYPTTC